MNAAIQAIENGQLLILSGTLIVACLAKLTTRQPAVALRGSRPLTVGLALAEGALGVALLLSPHPSIRLATIMGFASATWMVNELRTHRPEGGCGCFGTLSTHRVGLRAVVRAALFTAAATATLGVPDSGLEVLRKGTVWVGVVLIAESTLFASLSPEIMALLGRLRAPVPCELRTGSLNATFHTLHRSRAWREYQDTLTSTEPLDVWRELCWRLLAYPGRLNGRPVEIVFAVSIGERRPAVRTAVLTVQAASVATQRLNAADDGGEAVFSSRL